jgi:hypothetical protein
MGGIIDAGDAYEAEILLLIVMGEKIKV